jgi:GDP-fucose protein O-fucosyltransferase
MGMHQPLRNTASQHPRRLAFRGYDAGLGNHKMSMDVGIALAYLDQRQLVPYGFTSPWRSTRSRIEPEFARCIASPFDLFEVPVAVDLAHLRDPCRPAGALCDWGRLYESVCHFLKPEDLRGNERFEHFRNGRPGIVTLDEETRAVREVVVEAATLATYEYFFYLDEDMARDLATVMARVRPRAPYRDLARSFATAMGRYNAVHVRRGDFVTHSYTPRSGQVSCEEITRNLEQVFDRETPLALCTDADELAFFEPLLRVFPRTFLLERELLETAEWRALFDDLPFNDDHGFSVLVQQIASMAETFVGTLFSSFTSGIQRTRGALGDPRSLFCYNDWPNHQRVTFAGCEFLANGSGPYSWNRIQFPVDPRAYSWLRVWPEAFPDLCRPAGC